MTPTASHFARIGLVVLLGFNPLGAMAQTTGDQSGNIQQPVSRSDNSNNLSTNTSVNPAQNANAQSGGNVFDFSSNGRNAPGLGGLGSFAGGPCTGESFGVSTTIPGFGVAGGRASEDESCQRRNWVQTLIGMSQNMSEADAQIMRRLAIEVMREDPYLKGAFRRVGMPGPDEAEMTTATKTSAAEAPAKTPKRREAKMADGCVVVVASNSPTAMRDILAKRGCTVVDAE